MPRFIIKITPLVAVLIALHIFPGCNKVPVADTTPLPAPVTTNTIADVISDTTRYKTLRAAVVKAGLLPLLSKPGASYTLFAPDDAAFLASGIPFAGIAALSAGRLDTLLRYHIIPRALPSTLIPTDFPNVQMPTFFFLSPPLISLSVFPSKRGAASWVNNIPITQADIPASNGVVHRVAAVVAPPQLTLKQIINSDSSLTFLKAAINRADSGQVGLGRFDSIMNFALANITVFAPTNNAFRNTLGIPDSSFFRNLPVLTVRGIIAYHLLGSRAFIVNLPTTTTPVQTLLGAAPFPPLVFDWSTGGLRLKGAANGGALYNFTSGDRHGLNGVLHSIEGVLRPQ